MGVTKTVHQEGTGPQPQKNQTVTIEYTGWLKDPSAENQKGKQYDYLTLAQADTHAQA